MYDVHSVKLVLESLLFFVGFYRLSKEFRVKFFVLCLNPLKSVTVRASAFSLFISNSVSILQILVLQVLELVRVQSLRNQVLLLAMISA